MKRYKIPLRFFFAGRLVRADSKMKLHREIRVSQSTVWFLA